MKNWIKINMMLLLCSFGFLANAQSHIDNNYKFAPGSDTYLLKGPGNTDKDYIALSVRNDKVTVAGRIYRTNGLRLQGHFTGKVENNGIIHGTVNWSVAPEDVKKATYFQLYKRAGHDQLDMAFYDNPGYKTNSRARSNLFLSANTQKQNTQSGNAGKTSASTTPKKNDKVKVRVDYKFIYLESSLHWDKSFLNNARIDKASVQLYGTGSIRAFSETSSGSNEIKAIGNANARVFDIPKSRVATKYNLHYYDSKKDRSWGGKYNKVLGFYSFARDAEIRKSVPEYSSPAIFPVNKRLEFEVNRTALEGRTERVMIDGQAHLSNKILSGDATFGNIHRKVYLHEIANQSKLTKEEKIFNRKLEGKGHANAGTLVDAPYYYFAIKRDKDNIPAVMIAFTVEIIE